MSPVCWPNFYNRTKSTYLNLPGFKWIQQNSSPISACHLFLRTRSSWIWALKAQIYPIRTMVSSNLNSANNQLWWPSYPVCQAALTYPNKRLTPSWALSKEWFDQTPCGQNRIRAHPRVALTNSLLTTRSAPIGWLQTNKVLLSPVPRPLVAVWQCRSKTLRTTYPVCERLSTLI